MDIPKQRGYDRRSTMTTPSELLNAPACTSIWRGPQHKPHECTSPTWANQGCYVHWVFTTFPALSSPVLFISAFSFLTMTCMELGLLSCFYVSTSLSGVFGLFIMTEDWQFSRLPGWGIFGLSERREGRCLVSSDCAAPRVWKASSKTLDRIGLWCRILGS